MSNRGSIRMPWISFTKDTDTGCYMVRGKLRWVVDAIEYTFEEWAEEVVKRGHMDSLHMSFIRVVLLSQVVDMVPSLEHEIKVLRRYGNKDCTAMADKLLEEERNRS